MQILRHGSDVKVIVNEEEALVSHKVTDLLLFGVLEKLEEIRVEINKVYMSMPESK